MYEKISHSKVDRSDCKNYRGISLLSIPGKVYGRILIEKVCSPNRGIDRNSVGSGLVGDVLIRCL